VINLTRTTDATYSVFGWNRIWPEGGGEVQEWSAEFHDGNLHRVETPRDRIVADCRAGTGTSLNIATGAISRSEQFALMACGIQAVTRPKSAVLMGNEDTRFGSATVVRTTDEQLARTYNVLSNGVIVGATISTISGKRLLEVNATQLDHSVPPGIFREQSLARSAVPDTYRQPPSAAQ